MANSPSTYRPDPLASGGATQKPFQENGIPVTGSIVPTLLRLAMRRMTGFGMGAMHGSHPPSVVKNAVTMGSHGKLG